MSDTIVFEGPDGRLYEIPAADAATYAVPGPRVAELRKRMAPSSSGNGLPAGHFRPGDPLPPGVPPPPSGGPSASTTIQTPGGGQVTLNFYFGAPTPTATADAQVEGYHMTFDANGIPSNHIDMLWGDYIDKQGHPAVGWHSHDPVTGNAQ